MKSAGKKWWVTPLVLLIIILLLHLLALQPAIIENFYSTGIYIFSSSLQRICTGWLPFSLGDVLYACAIIWLLYKFIKFFFTKITWKKFFLSVIHLFTKFLWVYVIFLVMWGLNYYRYGIGYQLKLTPAAYSTDDLKNVTDRLRDALNENRQQIDSLHLTYPDNKTVLQEAAADYAVARNYYPYLNYAHPDIKKMFSGAVGNYSGFLGYYNPFTGEAQVNTTVPPFIIPFTACHEIAHQIGYASESEASFVGYLAVKANNSPIFNYSAYFDLFGFANGELFSRDSVASKQNVQLLDTLVRKDFADYKQYLKAYKNPVDPLLSKIYGSYLKAHNQPQGIKSYNEVVAWMVAYYKKYGKI